MKPVMNDKRNVAAFIPFTRVNGTLFFYLQKRSKDAPRMPGKFGMWGGGIEEGETVEQAFYREIKEELTYVPVRPVYFSRFEHGHAILHLFIEEVTNDFETKVEVKEGEYGKFLSAAEVDIVPDVLMMARIAIPQIAQAVQT